MAAKTCPACGHDTFTELPSGAGSCARCGYVSGEDNRCPHCGAVARTEGVGPATVCAVCGGPRIPSGFGGEAATLALKEQKKLLGDARLASFATILQGMFAALATMIGLLVMPEALAGKLIVLAIAVVPLLLALRSRGRANAARAKAKDAGDRAWQAAAEDVARRAPSGVTVPGLAKTLQIEAPQADRLLTSLAVHDRTRIDVGDNAEVRYSVTPGAGARVSASGERDPMLEMTGEREREDETAPVRTEREPVR